MFREGPGSDFVNYFVRRPRLSCDLTKLTITSWHSHLVSRKVPLQTNRNHKYPHLGKVFSSSAGTTVPVRSTLLHLAAIPRLIRCIEDDANFKYESGNDEPHRGFGHICVSVDNLEAACKRFDEMGVKFKKRPEEGKMRVN